MPTPKKAYCFTQNNYTEASYGSIVGVCEDLADYAIVGREVGESGTPHLQGYIRFKKPYRFHTIKDRYLPGCHISVAAGSARQNRVYCSKDGDFREFGAIGADDQEGAGGTGAAFRAAMVDGRRGLARFVNEHTESWYRSGSNLLRNHLIASPAVDRPNISVRWFYGPPGTGKSRTAHELLPDAFIKEPRSKWWNGYLLESAVIIDDYGPHCVDMNHLLRWFDRYRCYVENKGGMMPLVADTFIVTSNFHPSQLFKTSTFRFEGGSSHHVEEEHPQLAALMRRINLQEFF